MVNMDKDVVIYTREEGALIRVLETTRVELIKSPMFYDIFKKINLCDGCTTVSQVIIDGETKEVIKAALSAVTIQTGISIFQGEKLNDMSSDISY